MVVSSSFQPEHIMESKDVIGSGRSTERRPAMLSKSLCYSKYVFLEWTTIIIFSAN